ncbi:unnamed protein product [marine sediment metagenome]|uniref:Uncharacterized protein n=1 Tax=marine sediment metagenome TaxID=412755 RepID=X1LJS7_9ZZZZ
MIKESIFISSVGKVDQNYVDYLKEFKDIGDSNAHSLFNLPHQFLIEEKKDILNLFIRRLIEIKLILKSK